MSFGLWVFAVFSLIARKIEENKNENGFLSYGFLLFWGLEKWRTQVSQLGPKNGNSVIEIYNLDYFYKFP